MEGTTIVVLVVLAVLVGVPLARGFSREVGGARGAGRLLGSPRPRARRRRHDEDEDEDD